MGMGLSVREIRLDGAKQKTESEKSDSAFAFVVQSFGVGSPSGKPNQPTKVPVAYSMATRKPKPEVVAS